MILRIFPKGADGKLLGKIMADLAELSIDKPLERLNVSGEKQWRSCLLVRDALWQFCRQGLSKGKTEDNSWLLNSEGNRDAIFVEGRRQILFYSYKWGRGEHFKLRKIRNTGTAANKSIIVRDRTLTSKEPWNTKGSKSTYHKLQTVTFWTLWNEYLLPKRSAKLRW